MKFPGIKKEISLFLSSEEAKVLKKDIAKVGLTAGAIAVIMAQTMDARAAPHTDSHNDAVSHGDHTSHTDGLLHTDGHSNHNSHADSHTNNPTGVHNSGSATYDTNNLRGGHNSYLSHQNVHTDS